ncbi:MAG: glycoside hydrolase family 3 protein, partial [Roseburia sp.]|nr:glycoside hydrolase family 3 protein [Roseburia sp.]
MDKEERRLKRQNDTKKAAVVVAVFLVILAVVIGAAVFAVVKFMPKNSKPAAPEADSTEVTESTESSGTSVSTEAPEAVITPETQQAMDFVAGMTLEQKIAQMFVITPEALTGYPNVTAAGDTTKTCYQQKPVGGIIYMEENLLGSEQTTKMLTDMQAIAKEITGLPAFLSVDEEGGTVTRIAKNEAFGVNDVGNMSEIGASGDTAKAGQAGVTLGTYLKALGFNVDFAPVADVLTNPDNTVIGTRSFGSDPQTVADMVSAELQGLQSQGVYGVVKHFPGHGGTAGDSHEAAVTLDKSLEDLMATELVPFERAVQDGVSFVMVGHISVPSVVGDDTPASLSQMMVSNVLREQLGYDGIVITDALNMGAVTDNYTSDQAAVLAVNAGVDMLLMPQDYEAAYNGLLAAVQDGTISEERIDES